MIKLKDRTMAHLVKRNYVKKNMDRMYLSHRHEESRPKADRKQLKKELRQELRGYTL